MKRLLASIDANGELDRLMQGALPRLLHVVRGTHRI